MPPCGNFGLLFLGKNIGKVDGNVRPLPAPSKDEAAQILEETMAFVSETGGLIQAVRDESEEELSSSEHDDDDDGSDDKGEPGEFTTFSSSSSSKKLGRVPSSRKSVRVKMAEMLPPLRILESMTAMTEVRGGQAGGVSVIEHSDKDTLQRGFVPNAIFARVRAVARKRVPLAADLVQQYKKETLGHNPSPTAASLTCIGHTRFATSSINIVSELHPHEWCPWRAEDVWRFNAVTGTFQREHLKVVTHISHNGDFDFLEAYGSKMTNSAVGLWLERVLHVRNDCRGDSPKVAGMMDLLRVQGRWAAAARLAWVRCICTTALDSTGGVQLDKTSPNAFPTIDFFSLWARLLERIWVDYKERLIVSQGGHGKHTYSISLQHEKEMVQALLVALASEEKHWLAPWGEYATTQHPSHSATSPSTAASLSASRTASSPSKVSPGNERDLELGTHHVQKSKPSSGLKRILKVTTMTQLQLTNFLTSCVRGFLRSNTYDALCEFLSRAEGSFGLQVHTSVEPGVILIASQGQPMSMSFDPSLPLVLVGSEAGALGVPVDTTGRWLSRRIDLDNAGEVVRIGEPLALQNGSFNGDTKAARCKKLLSNPPHLMLQCGIQIRSHSLTNACESRLPQLLARIIHVTSSVNVFDPKILLQLGRSGCLLRAACLRSTPCPVSYWLIDTTP